jgi:F-type H+-transporting ATPase subunit delta
LGTLLEAGQLDQLDAILLEFDQLVRRRPELKLARVTSAVPFTEAEKDAMRAKLTDRFGPDLEFEFKVDASLIGGVYLRVGDQVIDGSVSGKLAALRDRLTA